MRDDGSTDEATPSYAFGDSDLAAARLRLLDATFGPTTRRFLVRDAPTRPEVALDLGCGPGATTTLVHETVRPGRTIGLDASAPFLEQARATVPEATFVEADLVTDPLPGADLAFARYLLSHLPDPEQKVGEWRHALRPGGRLLIEENTGLRIAHPVFRRYEDAVAVVMGAAGGDLYVGERLVALADRVTRTTVAPPASVVARLFGMNLVTWGRHRAAAGIDVDALAEDLRSLESSAETGLVRFDLVQLVVRAAASSA